MATICLGDFAVKCAVTKPSVVWHKNCTTYCAILFKALSAGTGHLRIVCSKKAEVKKCLSSMAAGRLPVGRRLHVSEPEGERDKFTFPGHLGMDNKRALVDGSVMTLWAATNRLHVSECDGKRVTNFRFLIISTWTTKGPRNQDATRSRAIVAGPDPQICGYCGNLLFIPLPFDCCMMLRYT